MSLTLTRSQSATYTDTDIESVMRRVKADLIMIANSTGYWSEDTARLYAHDIELLVKRGHLAWVDVTLLSYGAERQAVRFTPSSEAGGWTSSRPGALWPRVPSPRLRIILSHTSSYTAEAEASLSKLFKVKWHATSEDTSHAGLAAAGGRDYASSSFGMKRKDWGQ